MSTMIRTKNSIGEWWLDRLSQDQIHNIVFRDFSQEKDAEITEKK